MSGFLQLWQLEWAKKELNSSITTCLLLCWPIGATVSYFLLCRNTTLFNHLCLVDLVLKARKQSHVLSPLVFSTQMDEDFIGRQSRTSRRVHASTVIERVTLRYLTLAHAEFVRAGFLCDS